MKVCLSCGTRFQGAEWRCPACGRSPPVRDGHMVFAPDLAERDEDFRSDAFVRLAQFEADNFWFRARNRLVVWAAHRYFPNADNLLEIGCGTGYVLTGLKQALPNLNLTGSDVLSAGLSFARQRLPEARFLQMDARRIPFQEEFSLVGAFDVLEHIEEDAAVLTQMFQAVKPGGGILLTVPQHPFLWSAMDEYACHKRRYTRRELAMKVRAAGFRILAVTSFVSLLLPALLVIRRHRRQQKADFDPWVEFRLGRLMNCLLGGVLALERELICCGLSLPAGGSLLLAARRELS